MGGIRWVILVLLLVVLVGLIAYARGREHRRGDEEGALGAPIPVVHVEV
jgi:hypothetical protein